ncbi:oxidoreductase [Apiospora arundinis]
MTGILSQRVVWADGTDYIYQLDRFVPSAHNGSSQSTSTHIRLWRPRQEIIGDAIAELLQTLKEVGITRLDAAGLYPPSDIGASQRLLGQNGAAAKLGFTIDTKSMVNITGGAGTLEPAKIERSAAQSANNLNFGEGGKINVFYAHAPDRNTPLQDQAAGFDAQYKKGLFNEVNYSLPLPLPP